MHWRTWAIPLAIGAGWEGYRLWRKARNAPVVHLDKDDPAMNEAIAQARATLPDFIRRLQAPETGQRDFAVKALFPDLQEHMWVSDVRHVGTEFIGTLGNNPKGSTKLRLGDEVHVPEDAISDWKYIANDVLAGGYSLRLLRRMMDERSRKDLDSRLDFKIPD